MAIMRRFEQILEANPDEPLYVTDVCAAIGVTAERCACIAKTIWG